MDTKLHVKMQQSGQCGMGRMIGTQINRTVESLGTDPKTWSIDFFFFTTV